MTKIEIARPDGAAREDATGRLAKSTRAALLTGTAILTALNYQTAAAAQEAEDQDDNNLMLEEVIVTATKISRSVQDIPLSITALTSEALRVRGIENADDLQRVVPGLVVSNSGSSSGNGVGGNMAIRGVSTPNSTPGGDPGVPVYVDGHYIQASSFAMRDMLDVQRVEVLRGPQGVLKGRNASGGSIELITKRPTKEFEGGFSVDVGSYDRREIRGMLSGPLSDRLRLRVAFSDEASDGYIENISPNAPRKDLMYDNSTSIRASAEYDLADNFDIFVSAYRYEDTGNATVYTVTGEFDRTTPYYVSLPLDYVNPTQTDPYKARADSPHENYEFGQGIALDLTWDIAGVTVKSLNAYNESRSEIQIDLDMTDTAPKVEWSNFVDYKTYSSELQLLSRDTAALQWVAGLFYYTETSTTEAFFDADPAIFAAHFTEINDPLPTLDSTAVGLYLNGNYQLSEKLELVLGGRFSYDKKSMLRGLIRTYGDIVLGDTSGFTDLSQDWSKFTYRAGLNYHASDNVMMFASYSVGYRAGGFNAFAFQELSYEPESIKAVEVGFKSRWIDNRVELNISAFRNAYSDKQETVAKVILNEAGEAVDFVTSIQNSSTATVKGIELEFLALVTENFSIDASAGYLDATYGALFAVDGDRPGLGEFDLKGNKLPFASDWKYNVGAQYKLPLGDDLGSLALRVDYNWIGEYYTGYFNRSLATTPPYADDVPARDNINARLTWTNPGATWQAELYVQNLANSADLVNRTPTFHNAGLNFVVYTQPRMFGFRVSHRF
ncbi:TonB-dependent receptor [Kordiimonas aestuarii]|uniref:TonB-dependent receptor n=1 Tax=Kordiimonas aestuarii TaxID=1005925 RepID=UPI0021D3104F|nr:TonB-dependent receptor [Kordiimonas aestuarii]